MGKPKRTDNRLKELGITMEDVEAFRKDRETLRRGGRGGRSKETTKDPNAYDEYAEAAKWKRELEANESRKKKVAKKNNDNLVTGKRKAPSDDDTHSVSDSSPKQKKRKAEDNRKRKGKMVDVSSSGDDKDWEATNAEEGSTSTKEEDEENVHIDEVRSKLYKKMKVQQRESIIPESKKTADGIYLPKSAVKFEPNLMGEILSVGEKVLEVEPGKKVLLSDLSAYEVSGIAHLALTYTLLYEADDLLSHKAVIGFNLYLDYLIKLIII
ncbi:hypothetical protein K1719_034720 [Acacia pycnantha]|nr:hypothetical protein K1719_034720 [Acacia pycnantha]